MYQRTAWHQQLPHQDSSTPDRPLCLSLSLLCDSFLFQNWSGWSPSGGGGAAGWGGGASTAGGARRPRTQQEEEFYGLVRDRGRGWV